MSRFLTGSIRRSDALGPKQKQQARRNGVKALRLQRDILAAWREDRTAGSFADAQAARGFIVGEGRKAGVLVALHLHSGTEVPLRRGHVKDTGITSRELRVHFSRCEAPEFLIKAALAEAEEARRRSSWQKRQRAATAERVSREDWFARMDQTKSAHTGDGIGCVWKKRGLRRLSNLCSMMPPPPRTTEW